MAIRRAMTEDLLDGREAPRGQPQNWKCRTITGAVEPWKYTTEE